MTEKDNEKTIEEEIAVHGEYGAEQIQVLEASKPFANGQACISQYQCPWAPSFGL